MTPAACLLAGFLSLCLSPGSRGASVSSYGERKILSPQHFGGVLNFSTFLLDRSSGMLYLGAQDAILAVDTGNLSQKPLKIVWDVPEDKRKSCVSKGKTEGDCRNYIRLLEFLGDGRIYVCGTYAFDPQCAFITISNFSLEKGIDNTIHMETGKGKCPFEPRQHYTAVMAGGILYTAVSSNFLGTLFDISRVTGAVQERIRTEQSISWLSEPDFVSSAFIQEDEANNPLGDDDKIYFFFNEVAKENDFYTKVKVPRVARVCKSDVGGMKTLQRRWTTFLKTQLVCEDRASEQRFNVLTDVFTVQHVPGDPRSTHFYGIFTSQWEREELSAVCVYSLADISDAMNGPFKELKKTCENWINPEPVPTPRPGQCLNNALKADGFESSLKLPDKVLTFMRDHPLMENSVVSAPLLVRRGITYTKLAVTLASISSDNSKKAAVLLLGTDRGELHRVSVVGQNVTLLQETPLFKAQEPINSIILFKDAALVGSPSSLTHQVVEGCSHYPSCEVCARARSLGCIWNAKENACDGVGTEPADWNPHADPLTLCNGGKDNVGRCSPEEKSLQVLEGLRVLLPCVQISPHPCYWEHPQDRYTRQHHSDLEVLVSPSSLGKYVCFCEEGPPSTGKPCQRAMFFLTVAGPATADSRALVSNRQFVIWYLLPFLLGVFLSAFICILYRRCGNGLHSNTTSSVSEKERDLLPSSDTPQSPSSASFLSEAVPLTKRNGTINGLNGGSGIHAAHIYCNTTEQKLQESVTNLALQLDGRTERVGQDIHAGHREFEEGLSDVMDGLDEELAKLKVIRGAPLAQCEESSI
ncbi:semaphorin-4F [Denticeps clupeoides]|uniref:Sema domain-containing protein n=1 Tax=Denticeps clupeoides TaxID=299321 RepID=A0AAY4D153_9TELE|nr:semaphorin-4F-like [Denticeps clupeoides]